MNKDSAAIQKKLQSELELYKSTQKGMFRFLFFVLAFKHYDSNYNDSHTQNFINWFNNANF